MRSRPPDFSERALFEVLASNWGTAVAVGEYVAVGGGSYHWRVVDDSDRAWWVTVDDLADKPFLGRDRAAACDGLRRALAAAVALRQSGLEFVVAPLPSLTGEPVHVVEEHYVMAVYPWIDGATFAFADDLPAAESLQLASLLARLHASPAFGAAVAPVEPVERPELENALLQVHEPWTSGPYAEPVRKLLTRRAALLEELLATFDRLAAEVRATTDETVVTHGEPHPANLLRVSDGQLLLVDWDTVGRAPPERDLWWLSPPARSRYCALAQRELSAVALDLYRLRWRLDDISIFVKRLRSAEGMTADTEHAWQALLTCIEPTL